MYIPKLKGLKSSSVNGYSDYLDHVLNTHNEPHKIISKIIDEYKAITFGGVAANQSQYLRVQAFKKGYEDFIEGRGSANDFFGLLEYTLENNVKNKFSEEEINYFKKLYKTVVK